MITIEELRSRFPKMLPEDEAMVLCNINAMISEGYTVQEAFIFHSVMEECNPDFPEEEALAIMAKIKSDKKS